ncbi:putative bifunctional diguanylate cyclase/phosphodiesterase [Paenibacillus pinistramenti]|uniref:putative bifunctional diguanylate cyclase/phosphodiesterase n=1 Tax=Paenibacillus pinistramenti TaxID=1768003 RepID=UPI0011084D15|nr:GGDEF and EAL domain-containing protein [Paenibacillus pinistramenti]
MQSIKWELEGFPLAVSIGVLFLCLVFMVRAVFLIIEARKDHKEKALLWSFFTETLKDYGILVWAVHPVKGTVYFSSWAQNLTRFTEKEVLGRAPGETGLREAGFGILVDLMEGIALGNIPENGAELVLTSAGGARHDLQIRITEAGRTDSSPGIYVLTGMDVTEWKRTEERLQLAYGGSGAIIWETDLENRIYTLSRRWNELMGYEEREEPYTAEELIALIHPEDWEQAEKRRLDHLTGEAPTYNAEYRMKTARGEYRWIQARGRVLRDEQGSAVRFAGSMIDVTDRKRYELQVESSLRELEHTNQTLSAMQERLRQQLHMLMESQAQLRQKEDKLHKLAYFDTVSGLPNRVYLMELLESSLAEPDQKAALLFIDTDNFKNINDTLGHKEGDQLIKQVGERLTGMLPSGAMLFRFGGDEFVMLVREAAALEQLQLLTRQLLKGIKEPFQFGQSELHLSVSIGIALYPEHASNPEELIKNADLALYHAQKLGKSSSVVYDAVMQKELQSRMLIESHLVSALDHDEFELHYQPQVDAATGRITGFEALLRWNNSELGRVSPDKFIRIAEDSRQINAIGEWVLLTASSFLKDLHDAGYADCKMSVNISVMQLKQEGFVDTLAEILEDVGLPPNRLEIEITESLFMESGERRDLIAKLDQVRQMGIGIALDDFGTGYSSLDYLRELPITTLKMDKKFVDPIEAEEESRSLASAILLIGHSLGLRIVAEGVETPKQLDFLKANNCDMIQGYLYSKPLPDRQIKELLERWEHGR